MNVRGRPAGLWLVLCAALATICVQRPAHATQWAPPVEGCSIVLPYAASYAGKTHRGVDLEADAGAEVMSPAAGTVTFAGQVPADGGGTCGAVTIELSDGLRVSLLPLGEVFVTAGDSVATAEVVGMLASTGDDSTPAPHLHLGLREGTRYLDPTALLPLAVPSGPEPDEDPRSEDLPAAPDSAPAAEGASTAGPESTTAPSQAVSAVAGPATSGAAALTFPNVVGAPSGTRAELTVGLTSVTCGEPVRVRIGSGAGPVTGAPVALGAWPLAVGRAGTGPQALASAPGARWSARPRPLAESADLPEASSIAPGPFGRRAWSVAVPALGGAGAALPALLAGLVAAAGVMMPAAQRVLAPVRTR